jgi:hypothetical protein
MSSAELEPGVRFGPALIWRGFYRCGGRGAWNCYGSFTKTVHSRSFVGEPVQSGSSDYYGENICILVS